MDYSGDFATIQRRLAETSDFYRRRLAVLEAVALGPGERALEVGCGGGLLLPAMAASVGRAGSVVGIDISADQIAAAKQVCAGNPSVTAEVRDVNALPDADGGFDAIVAIQVIEYLDDPEKALTELRRVCSKAGRVVIFATNWDTVLWQNNAPELTTRVVASWHLHAPYPNLPAQLRRMFSRTGFRLLRQTPVPIVNNSYHEDTFAYWLARLMAAFATAGGSISENEAEEWLRQLEMAEREGAFFFSSTPVLSVAVPC